MKKAITCHIEGRVQMVMYRDFALRNAKSFTIVGTVKNMHDGSVEVYAEGEEPALLRYIEKLKQGSLLSNVERIDVVWGDASSNLSNFHIIYK